MRRGLCDWVHATFGDLVAGMGRGQELDQRLAGFGLLRARRDAGREHGDLLQFGGQWTDDVDAGDRPQFADLLEAELGLALGDDLADRSGGNLVFS